MFEWVSDELEQRTSLGRLASRGTVRLVLKQAGLEPASVSVAQMEVVLLRLMPKALTARHVPDVDDLCGALARDMRRVDHAPSSADPHDVFRRLGGDEDDS